MITALSLTELEGDDTDREEEEEEEGGEAEDEEFFFVFPLLALLLAPTEFALAPPTVGGCTALKLL